MLFEAKANEDTVLVKTTALAPICVIECDEQLVPDHEGARRTRARAKIFLSADELTES